MSIDKFVVGCQDSKCVSSEFFSVVLGYLMEQYIRVFCDKESNLGPSEYTLVKIRVPLI